MAPPKLFTLEEAERTLPLVRRVVADLLEEYPRWRAAVGRFELLSAGARAEPAGPSASEELRAVQEEVAAYARRIDDYLKELEAVGCVFKGFEAGLVDFPSLREDRLVYLCWRLGEDHIRWWHELGAGAAGRQPVDGGILTETSEALP
jgi:hypothetical protein